LVQPAGTPRDADLDKKLNRVVKKLDKHMTKGAV
jgi:hypothetical protein